MKTVRPVQQVVIADNRDNEVASKVPERAVIAEVPLADLRRHVAEGIREARGDMRVPDKYLAWHDEAVGRLNALIKLAGFLRSWPRARGTGDNGKPSDRP